MKPLKIGIGGVRGVVGETFTPELAVAFAQAFGTYLGPGAILVGRDTQGLGSDGCSRCSRRVAGDGVRRHRPGHLSDAEPAARGAVARGARRHLHHGGAQRRRVERPQVRAARRALPECPRRRRSCWTSTIRASSRRPARTASTPPSRTRMRSRIIWRCSPARSIPRQSAGGAPAWHSTAATAPACASHLGGWTRSAARCWRSMTTPMRRFRTALSLGPGPWRR